MREQSSQTMIAVCGFAPSGAGVVRRWTRFTEQPSRVARRLESRQAMEDVTAIDGLELHHAQKLARAGVLTFDALADMNTLQLRDIGFDDAGVEAVGQWQETAEEKPLELKQVALDEIGQIRGIGAKTVKTLVAAGITGFDDLRAVPEEALEGIGLSRAAVDTLKAWRDEQIANSDDAGTSK